MRVRPFVLALASFVVCGVGIWASTAYADLSGRYRFVRNDGSIVEGEVVEEGDVYVVKVAQGITVRLRKNEVRDFRKIETEASRVDTAGDKPRTDKDGAGAITDDELTALLGADELGVDNEPDKDVLPALDLNPDGVAQMKAIAATDNVITTDHFALVYTSNRETALRLASRLEAIYRWNYKFAKMLNIEVRRPTHKLEIYFFGKHEEFMGYSANHGFQELGVLGFYMPDDNRSAFFDMDTWPPYAGAMERWKRAAPADRRRLSNWLRRTRDFQNMEVVQHEAAHHIHFNIGIFNSNARPPRWLSEGLAMMFELPPGSTGASLGTLNNNRIYQFQTNFASEQFRKSFPLKQWILNDEHFFRGGGWSYPVGWAITNYLYRKHRDKFASYMQKIAALDEDKAGETLEREKLFEDHFGVVDDKWQEAFFKYNMSLPVIRSQLPPLE